MKKTNDVLISPNRKFCLVGLRNKSMFEGSDSAPVVIAQTKSKLSAGYRLRILTKTFTAHQKLDTLSSKMPLPTGNNLTIICLTFD